MHNIGANFTSDMLLNLRPFALILLAAWLVGITGCDTTTQAEPFDPSSVSKDDLHQQIDHALNYTLEHRSLNTQDHAAWQILHGVLAYGRKFPVLVDGEEKPAVDYLLNGGAMKGFNVEPGNELPGGRRGMRLPLDLGTSVGQGHPDQWLAILAQADLPADQPIVVSGVEYQIEDWVRQVQLDIPRNAEGEFSWTLIGLTAYLPTDASWNDFTDQPVSITDLVEVEVNYALGEGPCGGTHRIIGLAMAINKHKAQGGEMIGPWAVAQQVVNNAVEEARKNQNADGSFSSNFIMRGGVTPDLAHRLGTTGHVVEMLSIALPEEELKKPWMKRAVLNLCSLFRKTESTPLECGALYHAAHGLALYRERVFE